MDLAKDLAQWRDASPEQWIARTNRVLPPVVVAALIVLTALFLADLTWRLLETPSVDVVATPVVPAGRVAAEGTDYQALTGWEPFGRAPDETSNAIAADLLLDAPETALNVTLVGSVVAQALPDRGSMVIPERGSAIIQSAGRQKVYWSGDEIESAGGATLHSVFRDDDGQVRVLLDRGGGRLEALRYSDSDQARQTASRLAPRTQVRATPAAAVPGTAAPLTEAVGEVAQLLSDHISFAMHTENGQVIGFRVQPRGDPRLFSELGLEPGDVLTEVNGMRLNDLRNAAQVMQAMGEAQMANVMIRRGGFDRALVLNVDQIQRLAESLQ